MLPMRMRVADAGEIAPGTSRKFVFTADGFDTEGFIVNVDGALHAYVNRCRHVPAGLDWVENQFFTEDGRYLQCATHGALYVPESGECVAGPPCGKTLIRIPLMFEGGAVWAECPDHLPLGT